MTGIQNLKIVALALAIAIGLVAEAHASQPECLPIGQPVEATALAGQ